MLYALLFTGAAAFSPLLSRSAPPQLPFHTSRRAAAPICSVAGSSEEAFHPAAGPAGEPAPMGGLGFPCPGPASVVGERDACGVGFIADLTRTPTRSTVVVRAPSAPQGLHGASLTPRLCGCAGR